jgi:hypothetical protein
MVSMSRLMADVLLRMFASKRHSPVPVVSAVAAIAFRLSPGWELEIEPGVAPTTPCV